MLSWSDARVNDSGPWIETLAGGSDPRGATQPDNIVEKYGAQGSKSANIRNRTRTVTKK